MKALCRRDENGDLVTLSQRARIINSGENTVRHLAGEAGAVRRIGKSYKINRRIFLEYIETVCSE